MFSATWIKAPGLYPNHYAITLMVCEELANAHMLNVTRSERLPRTRRAKSLQTGIFRWTSFYSNKSWHLNWWHFAAAFIICTMTWVNQRSVCLWEEDMIDYRRAGRGGRSLWGVAVGLMPLLVSLCVNATTRKSGKYHLSHGFDSIQITAPCIQRRYPSFSLSFSIFALNPAGSSLHRPDFNTVDSERSL